MGKSVGCEGKRHRGTEWMRVCRLCEKWRQSEWVCVGYMKGRGRRKVGVFRLCERKKEREWVRL